VSADYRAPQSLSWLAAIYGHHQRYHEISSMMVETVWYMREPEAVGIGEHRIVSWLIRVVFGGV